MRREKEVGETAEREKEKVRVWMSLSVGVWVVVSAQQKLREQKHGVETLRSGL